MVVLSLDAINQEATGYGENEEQALTAAFRDVLMAAIDHPSKISFLNQAIFHIKDSSPKRKKPPRSKVVNRSYDGK